MANIVIDAEKTPAVDAQPELETKPKKASKGAKPAAKKVKPRKKAKAAKKAKPAAKKADGKPAAERTNKKAEVIALMKRAKGATLADIAELTAWQRHTIRGFVSILGKKASTRSSPRRIPKGNARTRSRSSVTLRQAFLNANNYRNRVLKPAAIKANVGTSDSGKLDDKGNPILKTDVDFCALRRTRGTIFGDRVKAAAIKLESDLGVNFSDQELIRHGVQ